MAEEPLNPYQAPATKGNVEPAHKSGFSAMFFLTLVMLTLVLAVLLMSRGSFLQIYEDFEVELPLLTRMALHGSLPLLLVLVIAGFVLKEFLPAPAKVKRILNSVVALIVIGLAVIYAWAMIRPLIILVGDLN